uniref:RNase H type-1 domain-containing protein n=1 Tax=Manihot esculenta TaxID=3983 RepID=A0A2C9V3S1_MANES
MKSRRPMGNLKYDVIFAQIKFHIYLVGMWVLSQQFFYKINVDESFDFQSSCFKAAFLIRNSSNSLLDGNCCEGVASSSLTAEGFALYQDILFPISRNFLPVMVESDSFQLIAVVGGSLIAIL